MSDRDDAPPKEAEKRILSILGTLDTHIMFVCLRALPDATRWRLATWIVAGLDPTREKVWAAGRAPWKYDVEGNPYEDYCNTITAASAAAREARDVS